MKKIKREIQKKELKEFTAKPKTNKASAIMDQERGNNSGNRGLDLYNTVQKGAYATVQPAERDLQALEKDEEHYTFAPNLALTSFDKHAKEAIPKMKNVVPAVDKYMERMIEARKRKEEFRAATERGVPAPK